MTTKIEAKLREIDMEPDEEKALAFKAKLVQALRRALETINDISQCRVEPAAEALDDIAKILSAPNDKEGE